jgi:hypothetical protein
MSKLEIVVRTGRTLGGPSVYHEIRGNVKIVVQLAISFPASFENRWRKARQAG